MTWSLRPYQADVIVRASAEVVAGSRRVLIVAPTGSGKTVIAAEITRRRLARNGRVLFLAHRRELIGQAIRKLYAAGVDAGIVQAGFRPRPEQTAQVASVQTLHARAVRSKEIDLPAADLIIVDEAHHIRARTYRKIIDQYPGAIIIGLTATPCRADGRGLGNAFDKLIACPSVSELTAAGFLVPARLFAPTRPDLKGIQIKRGDFVEKQLSERVDTPKLVGDVVENWLRLAERRRTIVFACGVAHSLHIRNEFRRANVLAEHVDGGTPTAERDEILKRFAAGTVDIVCNAAVLCEGFDCPDASCLVLARPTRSLGLYRQMVGRVLRPAEGKSDALVLDHAGAVFEHGFPDDKIQWELGEDRQAENLSRAKRTAEGLTRLVECPECTAIRFAGKPCAVCGWRPHEKAAAIEVAAGDLGAVDRKKSVRAIKLDQRAFYAGLLWIARERGYQRGWAANKFKEKFGAWPAFRSVLPASPDDATRAWVRSRAIAFAKDREKDRGAA